jgi:tetrahydromethanopterin S-methyltransferase subunit B
MLSRKAANTNVIDIGLARPGLEPTIYLTRGEHVTQSTTYAVILFLCWPLYGFSVDHCMVSLLTIVLFLCWPLFGFSVDHCIVSLLAIVWFLSFDWLTHFISVSPFCLQYLFWLSEWSLFNAKLYFSAIS